MGWGTIPFSKEDAKDARSYGNRPMCHRVACLDHKVVVMDD